MKSRERPAGGGCAGIRAAGASGDVPPAARRDGVAAKLRKSDGTQGREAARRDVRARARRLRGVARDLQPLSAGEAASVCPPKGQTARSFTFCLPRSVSALRRPSQNIGGIEVRTRPCGAGRQTEEGLGEIIDVANGCSSSSPRGLASTDSRRNRGHGRSGNCMLQACSDFLSCTRRDGGMLVLSTAFGTLVTQYVTCWGLKKRGMPATPSVQGRWTGAPCSVFRCPYFVTDEREKPRLLFATAPKRAEWAELGLFLLSFSEILFFLRRHALTIGCTHVALTWGLCCSLLSIS